MVAAESGDIGSGISGKRLLKPVVLLERGRRAW